MNVTASKTLYTLVSGVLLVLSVGGAPAPAGTLEEQLALTDGSVPQPKAAFDGPQGRSMYVDAPRENVWLDAQLAISDGMQSVQAISEGPEGPRAERVASSTESFTERQRIISDGVSPM
ncbi:MAG TPA: hypothetical protein VLA73_06515 [Burkholderiales bacterium]|nr:hypothetical protein [Burkholderiales bacterium]